MDKYVKGFPTLLIDGCLVDGANTRIEIESFLYSFLHNEFIVPEENNFMFEKDCEIQGKGIFRGGVVCH